VTTTTDEIERAHSAPTSRFIATPKQQQWVDTILSGKYTRMATGGAIRGTKTWMTLAGLIMLMWRFPRSRWAVVRMDLPTLKRNTIPSIEKLRELTGGWLGELNQSRWEYTAANGSKLLIIPESIQDDPELKAFHGFEVNGFLLEECQELSEKTYFKSIERAGAHFIPPDAKQSWVIARAIKRGMMPSEAHRLFGPEQPPAFIFLTFNPTDEWPRWTFYEPHLAGVLEAPYFYLPTTIVDNPYAPASYLASLEELREKNYDEYERMVLGIWGKVRTANQLISSDMVVASYHVIPEPGPQREGLDVARYGDDDSVWTHITGNVVDEIEDHNGWDLNEVFVRSLERIRDRSIDADYYTIDTVGMGGGPADNLTANGYRVRNFEAGRRPIPRQIEETDMRSLFRFADLRTQAWWEFREKLVNKEIRINVRHPRLIRDLTAPRYTVNNRVIELEPKKETKKRTGKSPDYGDSVVMAAFDWPPRDEHWMTPSAQVGRLGRRARDQRNAARMR
jgi:hypothetical protein